MNKYVGVTAEVCKSICLDLEDSCNSITYQNVTKVCSVSAYTHLSPLVTIVTSADTDYYHRVRCEGKLLLFPVYTLQITMKVSIFFSFLHVLVYIFLFPSTKFPKGFFLRHSFMLLLFVSYLCSRHTDNMNNFRYRG